MKDLYTINQAAEMLGIHRSKVWRLMQRFGMATSRMEVDRRTRFISAVDLVRLKQELAHYDEAVTLPAGQQPPPVTREHVAAIPARAESLVSLSSYCIRHGIPYWTAETYANRGDLPVQINSKGKRALDEEGRRAFDTLFQHHDRWQD